MNSLIFEQVTSALTVKSICSPMGPEILSGTSLDDLEGMSCHGHMPFDNPARIIDSEGNTIGVAWFEDYYFEADDEQRPYFINDVMRDLEPNCLLSSNTTILDAVELFTAKGSKYFYVIDVNKIVGVLSYKDLFKPIGRIAFFSLALEIEDLALKLCQFPKVAEECWLSIPDKRKLESLKIFKKRYKRKPRLRGEMRDRISDIELRTETEEPGERLSLPEAHVDPAKRKFDLLWLVACTPLADKATMIWNQKLIPHTSRTYLLKFFGDLETIRNSCAHPGHDGPLLAQDRLADFVSSAIQMRKSLQQALQNCAEEPV